MAAIQNQERFESAPAAGAPGGGGMAVRVFFLLVLLVLVVPSRLIALSHGAPIALFTGATFSTLLVWWLFYRLCLRARHRAWFTAASIPALYLAAFGAPLYAWAWLLVLFLVHRFVARAFRRPADAGTRADGALAASDARFVGPQAPPAAISSWVHAIDLDGVCRLYRRFLFSQRVIRAAAAAEASTVLVIPAALSDDGSPALELTIAALLTVSVALIAWMSFSWLRALWEGSARAARIGLLASSMAVIAWVVVGVTRLDGDEIASGKIWFQVAGRVLALPEIIVFPFPGVPTLLERHYFSAVTMATLVLPAAYVSTQVTLEAAERMRHAARRASLRKAADVLREDPRPPVLFLRDFIDDQVSLDRTALPGWARALDPSLEQANLEDVLAACLNIGPVVAIGRPGDVTPPVGAARQYVSDDEWQSVVLSMMEASAVVVAGVSDSPGLGWEIDRLRDRQYLGKTVFVVPPTARRNHRLTHLLVSRLQPVLQPGGHDAIIAGLEPAIGARHVVGITLRQGVLTVFVTERQPSQVELDAMLCLTLPAPQAALGRRRACDIRSFEATSSPAAGMKSTSAVSGDRARGASS